MNSWLQLLKIQELQINYTGYTGSVLFKAPEINLHYIVCRNGSGNWWELLDL